MTKVIDGQGQTKFEPAVHKGMVIAFSGPRVPTGWAICNGANGTPDLTDRFMVGASAVGAGTPGGAASPETGLVHTGFAVDNHTNHSMVQGGGHTNHAVTQPGDHPNHVMTQPSPHADHDSLGDHTHNTHTTVADGSPVVSGAKLAGPSLHNNEGAHTHDAHSAHTGWNVSAHTAHSATAVDAHSAHVGFNLDAHSVHGVTQALNHVYTFFKLAYIMKL